MGCCCSSPKEYDEYAPSLEVKSPVQTASRSGQGSSELMVLDFSTAVLGGSSNALTVASCSKTTVVTLGGDVAPSPTSKNSTSKNPRKPTEKGLEFEPEKKAKKVEKFVTAKKEKKVEKKAEKTPTAEEVQRKSAVQAKIDALHAAKKEEQKKASEAKKPVQAKTAVQHKIESLNAVKNKIEKKEEKTDKPPQAKSAIQQKIDAMNSTKKEEKKEEKTAKPPQAKSAIQIKIDAMNSSNAKPETTTTTTNNNKKVRGKLADRIASLQSTSPRGLPISNTPPPNKLNPAKNNMANMQAKLGGMNMVAMLGGKPRPMKKDKPIEALQHSSSERVMLKNSSRRLPSQRKFKVDL
ncbi:hypothetical protein TrLO_g9374 [Triparma laevis f. longispina]|uniref:Uncharacterized protein n=1 Tax=Triparma laevis f. longispina TaxID=1714387 RepID=A0A9W7KZT5_9STRA|nr:hypothetical protein TrLO_g9374 [Triparma laevis f. longispina]